MKVIAGGGRLFIVLYVKNWPAVRAPELQEALDDGQVIGVTFVIPDGLIDGVLNVEDDQGDLAGRVLHFRRLLTMSV